MLESELKAKSDHIRTIIKARGISYPNITGKTFAVFRVDNRHHLMSIVSMIDPSPDWIVGVSSLELCLKNCSWIESKILNLYPWDAGTDNGITYTSPNQPASPRQPIRRLSTNNPNDPKSPFYDPTGAEMKPFARLYLSRQRLYEKICDHAIIDDADEDLCETEEWSEWSPCSATCGRGVKYKQRRYKHEESKFICHKKLTERAACEAVQKYCPAHQHQQQRNFDETKCELGPWSQWSGCSVTCGKGVKTRDRKYKNRLAAKSCRAGRNNLPKLQENLECFGEFGKCEDADDDINEDLCKSFVWSEWSPCSSTCGKGYKIRYRLSIVARNKLKTWPFYRFDSGYDNDDDDEETDDEFDEDNPCNHLKMKETVECYQKDCKQKEEINKLSAYSCALPKDIGACKSNIDRWYFDTIKGNCEIFSYSGCEGNSNNFKSLEECQKVCNEFQKELIANLTAHKKQLGVTVSGALSYNVQNDAVNGNNCVPSIPSYRPYGQIQVQQNNSTDCEITKWSNWSDCQTENSCGIGYKTKHRHVLRNGRSCPKKLIKRKKCYIPCNLNDCIMSTWSSWSDCDCKRKYQRRFRRILVKSIDKNNVSCPMKIEERQCEC